jgi:hypothetical protein
MNSPQDVAEYVELGARYVEDVAEALGRDVGDLPQRRENAREAMEEGETDVDDDVAEVIATVLVGDAAFYSAFVDWFPLKYRVFARPLEWTFNPKLRGVAARYVGDDRVEEMLREMEYSGVEDHLVEGRPAMSYVDGVGDRTVLADSVLHTEWYRDACERLDVAHDPELLGRTVEESPAYFAGRRDGLSDDVAETQRHLFLDAEWLRRVDRAYGLHSWVMESAADAIEEAVEEL